MATIPKSENPLRVVVAEDEALIRLDLREFLQEEGYEVVADTSNGAEALKLVKQHLPDLAILDIKMPEMDGISVADQISQTCAVVILTAFSQRDLVARAVKAGALAYLVKPFEQNELRASIELASARFKEAQALAAEANELAERLETRKLIDRAKGILMDEFEMKESEAFSFIQGKAMDSRRTIKAISEEIVDRKTKP